jgi:predicted PurR-regulated permease PerM
VRIAGQSIRAVALGIIVTAVVQAGLAGIGLGVAGVPYALALTALIFMLCLAQLGPLQVLLPVVIWLYWQDVNTTATLLLVWSLLVGSLDNFLRPILIRRGADLPFLLIMAGVIGGLLAFGVIGLFIGPVVLAVSYRLLEAWIEDRTDPSPAPTAED